MLKLVKRLKNKYFKYKLMVWMLTHQTHKKLTPIQKDIFLTFVSAEEHRYKSKSWYKEYDWNDLITFAIQKHIWVFIPTVLLANNYTIKNEIDNPSNLYTVIDGDKFSNFYFECLADIEPFLNQKWYTNKRLPIVVRFGKKDYVLDGNHRLCQQIKNNDIKYYYVTGLDISWKALFKLKNEKN